MVVCVEAAKTRPNALAVAKAVQDAVQGGRHDSFLTRVKQCLRQCVVWPWNIEDKFPVVAEVKGLGEVEVVTGLLVKTLRGALGLEKPKRNQVVSYT